MSSVSPSPPHPLFFFSNSNQPIKPTSQGSTEVLVCCHLQIKTGYFSKRCNFILLKDWLKCICYMNSDDIVSFSLLQLYYALLDEFLKIMFVVQQDESIGFLSYSFLKLHTTTCFYFLIGTSLPFQRLVNMRERWTSKINGPRSEL